MMNVRTCCLFAALLTIASTASATITPVSWYKLGEDDTPIGVGGGAGNATTDDSVGSVDLTKNGTPTYSSSVSPSSPSSTLSMYFDLNGYYNTTTLALTATSNIGMELWANFDSAGAGSQRWLTSNGNAGANGYAFQQDANGDLLVWAPGTAINTVVFTDIVANQWYHLGFVVDSVAGAKVYIDGAVVASFPTVTAIVTPTDSFNVGISNAIYAGHVFDGKIDNVRLFTFAQGAFSTSDFLIAPVPEPNSVILLSLGMIGIFRVVRRHQG
jgi:hypothetical protein